MLAVTPRRRAPAFARGQTLAATEQSGDGSRIPASAALIEVLRHLSASGALPSLRVLVAYVCLLAMMPGAMMMRSPSETDTLSDADCVKPDIQSLPILGHLRFICMNLHDIGGPGMRISSVAAVLS